MRELCRRCLRPVTACICAGLPRLTPRIRVVILQHPREGRHAFCSAWICHAALEGSELWPGVRFEADERVRALCQAAGTFLLFPGEGATPARELAATPPTTVIAIDATWPQAKKLLRRNPTIAALPRVAIEAAGPSVYAGLRKEPEPGYLSTIDAVAEALGALEGDAARYQPMRTAFRLAVEKQLEYAGGDRRLPRHRPGAAARYGRASER
jgi:DTW domain-containing protein